MDFSDPLLTMYTHARPRVLGLLVSAERALSGGEVGRRAGISDVAALRALDELADSGLVGRIEAANVSLHALAVDHVAGWDAPPATVALRVPCPARRDDADRELIDVLVAPADAASEGERWRERAAGLAAQIQRWTGHHAHLHLRLPTDGGADAEDELPAVPWTLVAGHRLACLAFTDQ